MKLMSIQLGTRPSYMVIAAGLVAFLFFGVAHAQNSLTDQAQAALTTTLEDLLPSGTSVSTASAPQIMVAMYELVRDVDVSGVYIEGIVAVLEDMPVATRNAARAGLVAAVSDMVEAGRMLIEVATVLIVETRRVGMPSGYFVRVPQFVPDPETGKISLQSGT